MGVWFPLLSRRGRAGALPRTGAGDPRVQVTACDWLTAPVGHASYSRPTPPTPGRVPGMHRAALGRTQCPNQLGEVTWGLLKATSGLRLL